MNMNREYGKYDKISRARHTCNPDGNWSHCVICDGRIHDKGCTSKMRPLFDCCPQRHRNLFNAGQIRGIYDSSFLMWTPEHPTGFHDPQPRSDDRDSDRKLAELRKTLKSQAKTT